MQNRKNTSVQHSGKKSGFTLVEMLIVIVIIGILAAALIPRLTSARGRANDVARKASLQQIATALISYQIDNSEFPTTAGGTSSSPLGWSTWALTQWGMASIPKDPGGDTISSGLSISIPPGEFGYQPITKNGQVGWWIVLMANIETEWSANYIVCPDNSTQIISSTTFDQVQERMCSSFVADENNCSSVGWKCTYVKGKWQLRYIYVY